MLQKVVNYNKKFQILLLIIALVSSHKLFAQAGTKLMLDETSVFALQNVPIYDGVEDFQARLDQIREEKGREPMGLVLCGGSARAFAHIGTLKALEDNGVIPDFIIANSMGAIIGMFYAYGYSPDKIAEVVSQISLTKYFEPVVPIHGGILSVRKFRALINDLLGQDHTDIRDCTIPILILSEDLYTKRQIWHARGDFANIMTASFAMSAIMEPTKYTLNDQEKTSVSLIDSGAIDIAGLSIAESFSTNIVISTAFYDAKLNYNNPIVILNRTMSIGKERQAVEDIKFYKPVVIRNDVEHFSFMAFDKAEELSQIGYESTLTAIDEVLKCPHGYTDLSEVRARTDVLADTAIRHVLTNETLKQDENYFGLKVWPVFPVVDYPDYSLYNKIGVSAYAFEDASTVYARFGTTLPFNSNAFTVDGLIGFNPSALLDVSLFASYGFNYRDFKPAEFFGAATVKLRPAFLPYAFKSLFTTVEYSSDYNFAPKDALGRAGIDFELGNGRLGYLALKPYYFIAGNTVSELSNGVGTAFNGAINSKWIGIADNFSIRYAFSNFSDMALPVTHLYDSDYFRAQKPGDFHSLAFTNASELYFVHFDPGITAAELIILQQIKAGGFYDLAYTGSFNSCAGGFVRAQISLIGLCDFIFEGGCGWNFAAEKMFGYFAMKNRF